VSATSPGTGDAGASLHADALAVLRAWTPPSTAQAALRDRYVTHLETHSDGMTRSCFPDHLTAGALVLSADGDAVLLNLHRKARRWFHFGGHCEPGDTTLAGVAVREALEESGLASVRLDPVPVHLDEHAVAFCDPRGEVHHLDVRFAALADRSARHAVSEESLDVHWWRVDNLPDVEEEMRRLVAAARERLLGR
jgi:8-oxo-dGTP pyrophosphatase MutT (NUDIX family)